MRNRRSIKVNLLLFFVFYGFFAAFGQQNIPIGTWRVHQPHHRAKLVENCGERIFCSGKYSFFYYDKEDLSINKLSKSSGFSDVGITAMRYSPEKGMICFGYENGNLDIVQGNVITNFDAIKNITLPYAKTILDIDYYGEYAYIATIFGIFVVRIEQTEIKEVYRNLGSDGEHLDLFGADILRDTIFLATGEGVIAGSLDRGINLLDFRNWKRYTTVEGFPVIPVNTIVSDRNIPYVLMNDGDIYFYKNGKWANTDMQINEAVITITSADPGIVVTAISSVYHLTYPGELIKLETGPSKNPKMAALDNDGIIWIADGECGLVTDYGGITESYFPSGPYTDQVNSVHYGNSKLIALPGGYDSGYNPEGNKEGFSVFENGIWTNHNNSGMAGSVSIPDIQDLIDVEINADGMMFASFGYGIMEQISNGIYEVTDAKSIGSDLEYSTIYDSLTLVSAVTGDKDGSYWFINFDVEDPLKKRDPSGKWQSYSLMEFEDVRYALDLIIPSSGDKWIRMNPEYGGGILVFGESSGQARLLNTVAGNGGLPSNAVNDMIEDRDGQIWLATARGVAFFPISTGLLSDNAFDAVIPIFDQRYLLRNEYITSIEVDGGNRKWIGTREGVWLFSDDGSRLIEHFNTENSPLISDHVLDIEIDDITGEVFFATDKGLVSYRGTGTEAETKHTSIKIFPNPVTSDFKGMVGITGLAQDVIVKITDISGKLIWETKANGGTATWNVRNYNGYRAATGIYLVFSSSSDGKETFVGKIAVIN